MLQDTERVRVVPSDPNAAWPRPRCASPLRVKKPIGQRLLVRKVSVNEVLSLAKTSSAMKTVILGSEGLNTISIAALLRQSTETLGGREGRHPAGGSGPPRGRGRRTYIYI